MGFTTGVKSAYEWGSSAYYWYTWAPTVRRVTTVGWLLAGAAGIGTFQWYMVPAAIVGII